MGNGLGRYHKMSEMLEWAARKRRRHTTNNNNHTNSISPTDQIKIISESRNKCNIRQKLCFCFGLWKLWLRKKTVGNRKKMGPLQAIRRGTKYISTTITNSTNFQNPYQMWSSNKKCFFFGFILQQHSIFDTTLISYGLAFLPHCLASVSVALLLIPLNRSSFHSISIRNQIIYIYANF